MENKNINNLINDAIVMTNNLSELSFKSSGTDFLRGISQLQFKLKETKTQAQILLDQNKRLKKNLDSTKRETSEFKKVKLTEKKSNSQVKFKESKIVKNLINQFDFKESQIKAIFNKSKTLEELAQNIERLDHFLFNAKRMFKFWKNNPKIVQDLNHAKKSLNNGEFQILKQNAAISVE